MLRSATSAVVQINWQPANPAQALRPIFAAIKMSLDRLKEDSLTQYYPYQLKTQLQAEITALEPVYNRCKLMARGLADITSFCRCLAEIAPLLCGIEKQLQESNEEVKRTFAQHKESLLNGWITLDNEIVKAECDASALIKPRLKMSGVVSGALFVIGILAYYTIDDSSRTDDARIESWVFLALAVFSALIGIGISVKPAWQLWQCRGHAEPRQALALAPIFQPSQASASTAPLLESVV